ncbi:TetR/AcrR family transcriptional regulator [Nonomuraea rhizosphaerae]|uniref:TetR/AcrR family transcriptional regulator n=1 Tax=Nonomuraea rhizosphaerae TaxID=2665663 RepID=UPI001C601C60|nr:TetR/AcrR family transcriptional regulator [Nonomuraea rhizosphaerae]
MTETLGRRDRKKAATRQALADAALRLFLERGYDQVSVKDVADAADVSTTTLFKHFPCKEALVYDRDTDREAALVAVVRDRPAGQSLPGALREHVLRTRRDRSGQGHPRFAEFLRLTHETPALATYGRRMWLRHESALAQAIAADVGLPAGDAGCAALARFALEIPSLAHGRDDEEQAINQIFDLLETGWPAPPEPPA